MLTKINKLQGKRWISIRLALTLGGICLVGGAANAEDSLDELFAKEWQFRLQHNPLMASFVGVHQYDDRLPDVTPSGQGLRAEKWRQFVAELDRLDSQNFSRSEQINAHLFRRQLLTFVGEIEFGTWQVPITSESGFHTDLARLPARLSFETPQDYQNYLKRLNQVPDYFAAQIENMRLGLERGWTQPAVVLKDYQLTALAQVSEQPEQSVFFAPFANIPADWPQREQLTAAGRSAVADRVNPAYRQLAEFFQDEYIPGARSSLGASAMPDGERWYRSRVQHFATYDISPEQVHALGLSEVARIRAQMESIIAELEFSGDFAQFLNFLRSDPRFYAQTPRQLLQEAAWIAKRMDAALPALFNHLPRLPYGVAPVPEEIAPRYTGGRYVPPPAGSHAPGYYWVNTYDLASRPLYTLTALTLHEAVPGHHLQHAIALEQGQQPDFRRNDYISAYGEGWALYAEQLGSDAGLYDDPYSDFGRLTYEMWRACRLVVDTGIHLKGWTREQVVNYLAENTALSLHEVNTETDRYISWPAQALSYKLGELKIRQLRAQAEREMGQDFSLAAFHDAVLATGSVTLSILEQEIEQFISAAP